MLTLLAVTIIAMAVGFTIGTIIYHVVVVPMLNGRGDDDN